MDNIEIYDMTLTDLEMISDKLLTDFDDFWKPEILRSELENENSNCIVAKINDEIVGFAGIWKAVSDIHITNIVVKKDYRMHGIGKKLLEKLIQISKTQDINSITLEVNHKNIAAIELYSKYGFEQVGIRKNYYKGVDDAIIMTMEVTNEKK